MYREQQMTTKEQLLVDTLFAMAIEAERVAKPYRGTSSPGGFGPVSTANAYSKCLDLAVTTLGVRPSAAKIDSQLRPEQGPSEEEK